MADFYADHVADGSETTGLGTLTLEDSAPDGYQTLDAAGAVSTNTVVTLTKMGSAWEIARGVYTSPATLTRGTLLSSSTGSWINWGVGMKTVSIILAADTLIALLNESPTFVTVNATTVDLGDWTVTESAGVLYFKHSGTNKMKLDSSGNVTATGDVSGFGTV